VEFTMLAGPNARTRTFERGAPCSSTTTPSILETLGRDANSDLLEVEDGQIVWASVAHGHKIDPKIAARTRCWLLVMVS